MADEKRKGDEAVGQWIYFVDACDKICAQLSIADTFTRLSVYELQTKLNSLQKAMDNMIERDLQVHGLKRQGETAKRYEETIAQCEVWISKILARIAEINKEKRDIVIQPSIIPICSNS